MAQSTVVLSMARYTKPYTPDQLTFSLGGAQHGGAQ